jgi:release factor glutamine methyltransferase
MSGNLYTSQALLERMTAAFRDHGMEQSQAEAIAIIAELLNCNRLQAKVENLPLTEQLYNRAISVMQRRLANEPWQYIFERAYFRDLELYDDRSVLIPRPETELLADWCIEFLPQNGTLLDVGTGSGAIALSVALERQDAQVTACDVSTQALEIARKNQSQVPGNPVEFVTSDLLDSFDGRKFDIIAANLPYVTEAEHAALSPEVRDFEPELALTADNDGLQLIYKLIDRAPQHLNHRGAIILEMSEWQTAVVAAYLQDQLCWSAIEIKRDYTQRNRFVIGRLREQLMA